MAAAVGMGKFVSGREKKKQKKINTQSLEDSFGRLGLPVQEINAKYVKIPGQSVEKISPEEVENNPGALFDTFGNAYVGSDRYARLDHPLKVGPFLLSEVDDILLLVPSSLRFATMIELEERLEAEVEALLNQPMPRDNEDSKANEKDRERELNKMANAFRDRLQAKVHASASGAIELVDVMEACTKTLAAQQEAQSANGFELEVQIPVGRLEFRAAEERKYLDKEAVFQHSHHVGGVLLGFKYALQLFYVDLEPESEDEHEEEVDEAEVIYPYNIRVEVMSGLEELEKVGMTRDLEN